MSREHSQHRGNTYPLPTKAYHQKDHMRQQQVGSDRQVRVVKRAQGHSQQSHGASRPMPVYNKNYVGQSEVRASQEEKKVQR